MEEDWSGLLGLKVYESFFKKLYSYLEFSFQQMHRTLDKLLIPSKASKET